MAYRSSLDAKMSQSKCIGVWGMPYSQSVHCAWLPGTASMCPVEYVRYWFIEYDSSSSSFLYIVHMCSTCMLRAHVNVTCVSDLLITLYIYVLYLYTIICIVLCLYRASNFCQYCLSIQAPQLKSKMAKNFSLTQNM